ncbi:hypothetical protein [Acetobacter indonesiensis]|nr:hypothetical protein [Acetobacter indonesiensis]
MMVISIGASGRGENRKTVFNSTIGLSVRYGLMSKYFMRTA